MINIKDIKKNYNNIKWELKAYKPEFKLATLYSKIESAKKELESAKKDVEDFKNYDELINLDDIYVLSSKNTFFFVIKKYVTLKDGMIADNYQGIYQGYFSDVFTKNIICHFKQIVNYNDEVLTTTILGKEFNGTKISTILDYINLNEIYNGKISYNTLKKIYLKHKK